MTAFVIVDIEVTDPEGYDEYKKLAAPTVAAYGGLYIARGGKTETLEGGWHPNRLVILQFENMERAKAWWNSAEYELVKGIRYRTANSRMIVVEGL